MSSNEFSEKAKEVGQKTKKFFNSILNLGQPKYQGQGHKLGHGPSSSSSQAPPPQASAPPPSRPPAQHPYAGRPQTLAHNPTQPKASVNPEQLRQQRERQLAAAEARQKLAALPAKLRQQTDSPSKPLGSRPQPSATTPAPPPPSMVERLGALVEQAKAAGFTEANAKVLGQILVNLKEAPHVEKFRRIRAGNAKIREALVQFESLVTLLGQVGFQSKYLPKAPDSDEEEKYFVFPAEAPRAPVEQALGALIHHFPIVDGLLPSSLPAEKNAATGGGASPRERNTKVLVPQPSSHAPTVSNDFFKRTPQELRNEYLAAQKAKEQQEVLMTRAQREKLQQQQRSTASRTFAIIRIHFPEGVDLQGEFNPQEPLTRVFEWVSNVLHNPCAEFDLLLAGQGPLGREGTVAQGGLVPGASLTLLVRGEQTDDMCLGAEWIAMASMET